MGNMKNEIKALLSADREEKPLSESELAKLKEACDKLGLPIRAFQYTVVAARAFIAESFGDDDAEKDTKKKPDGDSDEKLLDKDKKTEGEKPDFLKKNDDDEDDKEKKDDEKDEDTTSANIATVPLPMGNFKKKDTESVDAERIARIRAKHRLAKMSESRRKPLEVSEIVESLLEDEQDKNKKEFQADKEYYLGKGKDDTEGRAAAEKQWGVKFAKTQG